MTVCGTWSKGKKTPLTWNIGIMNMVRKLFIAPMVVAEAVKIRTMEANQIGAADGQHGQEVSLSGQSRPPCPTPLRPR